MPTPITLKVFRGNELVRTEQFSREIIKIGRLASAHLVLDDERISRIHAVIEVAPDGAVSIIDMGSAEGTFVNGKKVSRSPLKAGDQVALGGLRLVLEAAVPAASSRRRRPRPGRRRPPLPPLLRRSWSASPPPHGRPRPGATAPPAPPPRWPRRRQLPIPPPAADAGPRPPPPPSSAASPAGRPARSCRPIRAAEDLSGVEDVGVELRLLWGDTLLDAATFVRPSSPVLVGKGPRCGLQVEGLPQRDFPMLRWAEGDYQFAFGQGMTGALEETGTRVPFAELVKSRRAATDEKERGSYWVPVPRTGAVRAELGADLAVEARAAPAAAAQGPALLGADQLPVPQPVPGPVLPAVGLRRRRQQLPVRDRRRRRRPVQEPLADGQVHHQAARGAEAQADEGTQERRRQKGDPGEMAEKHKGEEGQMGKKDAPKTNARSAPQGHRPERQGGRQAHGRARRPRARRRRRSPPSSARAASAATSAAPSATCSARRWATASASAAWACAAPAPAAAAPARRSASAASAPRGAAAAWAAARVRRRRGAGNLGKKGDRTVAITAGNATVMGSIDKELIRKVIQEHAAQIRFCYEEQLAVNPQAGRQGHHQVDHRRRRQRHQRRRWTAAPPRSTTTRSTSA